MPAAQTAWVAEPERGVSESTPATPSAAYAAAGASTQASTVATASPEVTYVPLAVSVGDGFKFGCGFFLAAVVALLIGFVIFAAVFVLSTISGVTVPLGR